MKKHPIATCDRRLKSLPNYDRFRCKPPEFICACGRHWAHVCDEAEGCSWTLVDEDFFRTIATRPIHLPSVLSRAFGISTSEARRSIAQEGVKLNGVVTTELDVPAHWLYHAFIQLGKRRTKRL